jgi:hypothetical protein
MSGRSGWRGAVAAAVLCGAVLTGCQYGYSRSALEGEAGLPPEPGPRGYVSYGYDTAWTVSPWFFSFSYTFADPYGPHPFFPAYSYYPYYYPYYYPPRYVYPYPYVYAPYRVVPAPRRILRVPPGSGSTAPGSTSPNTSRRRLNLP